MLKARFAAAAAAMLFTSAMVAPASAATITYTFTGNFQGTLNGGGFDVPATFTGIGDTDDVTDNGFSYNLQLQSLTAVANGVTYTVTDPSFFYINRGGYAGLEFGAFDDTSYFSGNNDALIGYDAKSAFASTSINYFSGINAPFNTDQGAVVITGASNGSFSASLGAVPEPSTWALMILGFGAVGGAMRRRQSVAAKVRFA